MRRWVAIISTALVLGGCTAEPGPEPEPQGSVAGTQRLPTGNVTLVVADPTASPAAETTVCWTATQEHPDGERTRVNKCTGVSATRVFELAAVVVTACEGPTVHVKRTAGDLVSTTAYVARGTFLWPTLPTTSTLYVSCQSPFEPNAEIIDIPITG